MGRNDLASKYAELELELQAKAEEADRFKMKVQLLQSSLDQARCIDRFFRFHRKFIAYRLLLWRRRVRRT